MRAPYDQEEPPLATLFCNWDITPDLAQVTWEWPAWGDFKRFPKTRVLHMDRVAALELGYSVDWPHDFAERLYHEDPLWAEIRKSKGV